MLDAAARLLAERRDEFAEIIADEAAKPIKTARVEAERAVGTFQFAAAEARTLGGDVVAARRHRRAASARSASRCASRSASSARSARSTSRSTSSPTRWRRRSPPAARSCSSRPARRRSARIALAELLIDECGLPAEWLHVVTGGGSTVGNAIVDHADIALITFTGSPDVGWAIRGRAPRKKVGLELGNNAPVIIEADSDWQTAAAKISVAGFTHAGQSCISTQRVLVQRDIADEFLDALVKEVSSLVVGDPLDEATDVSALISAERARPRQGVDRRGRGQGATVADGGERRRRTACWCRPCSPT